MEHKQLADGKWNELSLCEQMANIGSEVHRAINWKEKNNDIYSQKAFDRALELFGFTIDDPKNLKRLKEILRAKELFIDFFAGNNIYNQTINDWQKYFFAFNMACSRN